MRHVLSLIAAKSKSPLSTADVERARGALDAIGAGSGEPRWLASDEACDIPISDEAQMMRAAVRTALGDRPIDVNIVAEDFRRKRLLLADMDSTMIGQECIDELAGEVGLREKVAAITERAMRGEIAFEPALRERVALLKGLSVDVVEKVLAERISITPGATVMVATMREHGARTVLVSGGFTAFVEPIGKRIGFHETRANSLMSDSGVFTGAVSEPILGAGAKERTQAELAAQLKLDRLETLAVGDGANDSGMIREAGLGVGFRPKPALRAIADATIDHGDLTALLFLQGYRREEFVEARA
jgi:phosphoserine phosphatase